MIILLALLVLSEPQALWDQANEAYGAERYPEAIEHYTALLEQGVSNGNLHYNLGNAYFKKGELGSALLHYYRAERLLPGDKDIAHNIELANQQRRDPVIEGEREGLGMALDQVMLGLPYRSLFSLTFFFLCVSGLACLPLSLGKKGRFWGYTATIAGIIGVVLTVIVFFQHQRLNAQNTGIVMSEQVDVLAGPSPREAINFTIHEGIVCQILETQPGWYRIRLANGYNGWLPQKDITKI